MIDEKLKHAVAQEIWDALSASGLAYEAEERRAKVSAEAAILAILTALEAKGYVIEQGWQQIETAPKDGTRVLLAVKPSGTIENWYGRTPPDVDGFGIFKHLDNGWSTPGSGGWDDFFFSGWRPLPEPPAMLSASDGEAK